MIILTNENITDHCPEFKKIASRVVRLTVWNLNGTTSEMKFYIPVFCWNGDDTDRAGMYLQEWCQEMTKYYLKITAYQIDFGSVLKDGTERFGGHYFLKQEVPLNKVFRTGALAGKWVSPEAEKKRLNKKTMEFYKKRMSENKSIYTGKPIKRSAEPEAWQN